MAEDTAPTIPVPFKGRDIHMAMPTPEQILVWRRTLKTFEGIETRALNGAQALAAADRCVRIVTSLFALREDREWLDDAFLDGDVKFSDLLPLFSDTVTAFSEAAQGEGNREERRAAAKKATRKAPARKAAPAKRTTTPRSTRS